MKPKVELIDLGELMEQLAEEFVPFSGAGWSTAYLYPGKNYGYGRWRLIARVFDN